MMMVPLLPLQAINAIIEESSDVYLKKVIQELQLFNSPVSANLNGVLPNTLDSVSIHNVKNSEALRNQYWKTVPDYNQFDHHQYPGNQIQPLSINKIDNNFIELDNNNQVAIQIEKISNGIIFSNSFVLFIVIYNRAI